jgi:O-antigen ligase
MNLGQSYTGKISDILNKLVSSDRRLNFEQLLALVLICVSVYFVINKPGMASLGFLAFSLLMPIVFHYPKLFFILLIGGKMMINGFYNVYIFGDINLLKIIGALVPLFLIAYMMIKRIDFNLYPLSKLIFIFLAEVVVSSIITIVGTRSFNDVEKLLRLLNGLTFYFAIPLIFKKEKDVKSLTKAWLISACFPLALAIYQIFTGRLHIQVASSVEGIHRVAGIYHDISSIYMAAIIFVLLIFLYHNTIRRRYTQVLFYACLALASFVIYRTYSKIAALILSVIMMIYSIRTRSRLFLLCTLILIIAIFFTASSGIYKRIERDITVREQFGDRIMFTGRVGLWRENIDSFMKYSLLNKLIGHETFGVHNDFLRILLDNGILGFIIYTSLLIAITAKIMNGLKFQADPFTADLIFIAFLSHIAFVIISFGLTPTQYTDYQWFHWGFLGIAMRRIYMYEREMP